jgi:hypothetical protein
MTERRLVTHLCVALGSLLLAGEAAAVPLSFTCITGNIPGDCTIGQDQLSAELTSENAGQIRLAFANAGPAAASITDVYVQDSSGLLADLDSILSGPGVAFSEGASPGDLPGGNTVGFTATFSADSDAPAQPNGVNPLESLALIFDLGAGIDFDDVTAALASGDLRVGIHVQGFRTEGSESFVNGGGPSVPEPSAALVFAVGSLLVAGAIRRPLAAR